MGWKLVIALVLVLILGAAGLAFYGGQLQPLQQAREQVLPDDRFPN